MDRTLPPLEVSTPSGKKNFFLKLRYRLSAIHQEYGYLAVAFTVPAILMFLMYVARGIYPFGDSTVMVLDLNGQYVSFYEYLWDCLHGDGSLFYCFSRNLGGEFMGMFDYYVASPFAMLIGLFPREWIQETLLMVFLIKTGLCGFTMGFFLHKHSVSKSKLTIITFSVLYALSNYCIIQMHNSMWIDAVLWLPILAYAIEELIKRGRFRLFVFTLAITLISNFYIGYMVCIFTVAYCFYWYFAHNQNNENNPTGEPNHFVRSVIRVGVWSALAVGIAAFIILTARYSLSLGKDEFSNPSWEITQKFNLFELLIKFLPASYDTVRPEGLPFVYCGMLTVLLVPAFFISRKISNREKVAAAILILFFVGSFATSTIDLIWHGFQKPNWLNYRYSFMLCFFLIFLAFRAFENLKHVSRKALLGITAFMILIILVIQELGDFITGTNEKLVIRPFAMIWLGLGCLLAYFIIISLWGRARPVGKQNIAIVLVFLVCTEVFISGLVDLNSFDKDVTFTKHSRYTALTDTFRPITDVIVENDGGFYRMEKTYHRKTNDNYALNMNGLSTSTSLLNRDTIDFLRDMGYSSKSHWSKYLGGTPVNDTLLGIKYIISDKDLSHYYGDPIYTRDDYDYDENDNVTGNYDVYRNPYALSVLFGVSEKYANFDRTIYDNPFDRLNAMVTAMLGEDETVKIFIPAVQNGAPSLQNASSSSIAGHKKYEVDDEDSAGILTYSYTVPTDTELYYYFPSDYPREVKLNTKVPTPEGQKVPDFKVDRKAESGFGGNETQRIVSLGSISYIGKSDAPDVGDLTLEVRIENTSHNLYIKETWTSCVYYIDWAVYTDAMERLAETQMVFDEKWSDDHLTGTLTTTTDNQLMYTSIAYDEGWRITVDGKPVEIFESSGALVTFYVEEAGEHDIVLSYMPRCYSLGLAISFVCGLFFLLLVILYRFLCKMPVVKHFMGIQRPDLPMLPPTEDSYEADDIGAPRVDIPPIRDRIHIPEPRPTEEAEAAQDEGSAEGEGSSAPVETAPKAKPQANGKGNKSAKSKKRKK